MTIDRACAFGTFAACWNREDSIRLIPQFGQVTACDFARSPPPGVSLSLLTPMSISSPPHFISARTLISGLARMYMTAGSQMISGKPMGGWNSGNRVRAGAKATTEGYCILDVRLCARKGMLKPGSCSTWQWIHPNAAVTSIQTRAERDRMMLNFNQGEVGVRWVTTPYTVGVVRTPCHLGGSRAWFICPTPHCGRRVAVLYVGATLACRHCLRLAYASTREDIGARAIRRAEKLRVRLNWCPGIANARGGKPKWMHWDTFDGLVLNHLMLVEQSLQAVAKKIGLLA